MKSLAFKKIIIGFLPSLLIVSISTQSASTILNNDSTNRTGSSNEQENTDLVEEEDFLLSDDNIDDVISEDNVDDTSDDLDNDTFDYLDNVSGDVDIDSNEITPEPYLEPETLPIIEEKPKGPTG
jgi:hypothetical protein